MKMKRHNSEDDIIHIDQNTSFERSLEFLKNVFEGKRYKIFPYTTIDELEVYSRIFMNEQQLEVDTYICDSNNLECKMFALEPIILNYYIYLSLKYKFFQIKYQSNAKTLTLLQKIFNNEKYFDELIAIHSTFRFNNSIMYRYNDVDYPWNDFILAEIQRVLKIKPQKGFNPFGIAAYQQLNEPPESKNTSLFDIYDKNVIRNWAEKFSSIKSTVSPINYKQNDVKKFINHTHNHAISITGTACVGKTSILNDALAIVQSFDPNAKIYKSGRLGGFSDKDFEQIRALSYQYTMISVKETYFTSILDRSPLDNIFWRFILPLMNTQKSMVDEFIEILPLMTHFDMKCLEREPIIYIIDSDVEKVRDRMRKRLTGTDAVRAMIENYVPAQNMVYGVFAKLTNSIIIDLACDSRISNTPISQDIHQYILTLIKQKISKTVEIRNLPQYDPIPEFKSILTKPINIDYGTAINLNIFK